MRTEIVADIMATFGRYDLDGLRRLHPQTVMALHQQSQRIERQQYRRMMTANVLRNTPKALNELSDY